MERKILIFVCTNLFIFLVYWLGGGNFQRGESLGSTFALSIPISLVIALSFDGIIKVFRS